MTQAQPIVGITSTFHYDDGLPTPIQQCRSIDNNVMRLRIDNISYVVKCGATPLLFPPHLGIDKHDEMEAILDNMVEQCDVILLTGGHDTLPFLFGEEIQRGAGVIIPDRDNFEIIILEIALRKKKPIFGICRGMQFLNCYFGGTLYQDIPCTLSELDHTAGVISSLGTLHHKLAIEKDSFLHTVWNKDETWVNTYHHQAVKELGKGFKVAARASDGLIEAIEKTDTPQPIIGVQWHPESISEALQQESIDMFKWVLQQI